MRARNIGVVTMVMAVALLLTVSNGGIFGGGEALAQPPLCQITRANLLNVNFKCYTIAKGTNPGIGDTTLVDQFGTETVTVRESQLICTPANKEGGGAFFTECPEFHLKCYNVVPAKPPVDQTVTTTDQFETETGVKVQAAQYLCEGAFKTLE